VTGEVAFACEISEDRKHASVVAAGRSGGGLVLIDLVFYDHPSGAVGRLDDLYGRHDPVSVVVDGRAQSATLLAPLAERGVLVTQPSPQDVAVAHGEFLDLVNDGGMEHLGQVPLTAAVKAGQQRPLAGAQAWDRRLAVDQSPLVAATLACWAFRRWEELSVPGVFAV
jgi:hypothetical protein